ncbi:MAG: hypothetical protein ACPG21_00420 [Crocinitomicaceae bacterium]
MIKQLLFFITIALLFFGCRQEDLTPSWLKVNTFDLVTNEETQGWDSHGITDAWIYMDNQPIGIHEVPCVIPVLDEGEHNFTIFAGIKNNGISATRKRYPFYNTYEFTATLSKNDTLEVSPVVSYINSTSFAFIEDFENAGISFVKGPLSDTNIVFVYQADEPDIVEYGDKCGGIFLTEADSLFTVFTEEFMDLPKGEEVYLEVDYRNDNSIAMGVLAEFPDGSIDEQVPLIQMNPQDVGSEVWKKIYIQLSENVSFNANYISYEIYFLSILDDGQSLAHIYIDNIKVVHYQ